MFISVVECDPSIFIFVRILSVFLTEMVPNSFSVPTGLPEACLSFRP